ncbi:hypothetical protein KNU78_gp59 [Gordonia phage Sukkupi]|uniref:Uncharacterized protein n=1 Tax=Gordonia phage Sukkupi TaxID=2653747 RepID=A0A5Q2WLC8_9CAUD|nr:hypothetical protein KNU78_gp59 [Gordonia phage Sukkupi]QAU07108.1 hypothetical protein SEA_BIPAUNETO_60 [Gordonia phage BiPauneto]QGH79302.1 hypothetical protein SEA_SUKKUPI_59 [Gordonia phage Sukkupi]QGH80775.1 hypothetical protein SEA_YNDEXA_59 [Gordonia phage Yndexa]
MTDPVVRVTYWLNNPTGGRTLVATYTHVSEGWRVPAIGECLVSRGRKYRVTGVTWDLDGPATSQEVFVTAKEVDL